MDAYLLDSDAHSVSSQMFYPSLPMGMGLGSDGMPYTPDVLPTSMAPSHMDPVHMQLDFGHSPSASWASSLSPIESRISSPGIPEESWTSAPLETSPQVVSASPVMDRQSPRYVWSAPAEEGFQNLTGQFVQPPTCTHVGRCLRQRPDGELVPAARLLPPP